MRALHQELEVGRIFRDPLATRILGADAAELTADPAYVERGRLRTFIAVRHRFAEDSLAAAVARGTRQVVVLGAGLDTFAYRNPYPDTRVFEVDFPATGGWKRGRLADAGIETPGNVSFVGVDFETDDLMTTLVAAGYDAGAPTFFLWLGVVPYLTPEAIAATLRAIASVPGGEVVFDYSNPMDQATAAAQPDRVELRARVAGLGEPFNRGIDTAELHSRLRGLGFTEVEDLGRRGIRERYLGLPPGDSDGDTHVVRALRSP
jgi:methyltransferase (TIGR00027 family)